MSFWIISNIIQTTVLRLMSLRDWINEMYQPRAGSDRWMFIVNDLFLWTQNVLLTKPEIYLLSVRASLSWKLSFQIWHFTCPGKRESVILDPCIKVPDFSIPNSIYLLWFEPCLCCSNRTLCNGLYSHMIPWTKVE